LKKDWDEIFSRWIRKVLVDAADAIDATDAATPCSIAASTTDKKVIKKLNLQKRALRNLSSLTFV